jgi:hypothetical protein
VSLTGRLEDLSLADILQIVFLSRRSGKLTVRTAAGECSLLFANGLIAAAFCPSAASLAEFRAGTGSGEGQPTSAEVETWISAVLVPLLGATSGEFTFGLGDPRTPELGYDPRRVLGADGIPPHRFLGTGAKLKPLAALEESLKAGKSLLRRGERPAEPAPQLPYERPQKASAAAPQPVEVPEGHDPESTAPRRSRFSVRKPSVAGEPGQRTVVLFSRDPQVRVAIRRGIGSSAVDLQQFAVLSEAVEAVRRMVREKRFFLTLLECTSEQSSEECSALLHMVRRVSRELPVAVVTTEALAAEDTVPYDIDFETIVASPTDQQSILGSIAALDRFLEEQFWRWERAAADFNTAEAAAEEFYDRALRQTTDRKYDLLEALIMELSDPDDLLMIASTLIRAASEYVDRGAVYVVAGDGFSRVLAFGDSHPESGPERRRFTIGRSEGSVLADVAASGRVHRGKLRKSAGNVRLIDSLGAGLPTEVLAVPIVSGSDVVGVFYGDNAKYRQPISETAGLEIFLAQAGKAFRRAMSSAGVEGAR